MKPSVEYICSQIYNLYNVKVLSISKAHNPINEQWKKKCKREYS